MRFYANNASRKRSQLLRKNLLRLCSGQGDTAAPIGLEDATPDEVSAEVSGELRVLDRLAAKLPAALQETFAQLDAEFKAQVRPTDDCASRKCRCAMLFISIIGLTIRFDMHALATRVSHTRNPSSSLHVLSPCSFFQEPGSLSGTTATVAVVCGHELIVANVGDSLAFVDTGSQVIAVTVTHR